tara:strand:- start:895 stop:1539 length:645 start_codon:yes stop_codon:yes gene_type:complete
LIWCFYAVQLKEKDYKMGKSLKRDLVSFFNKTVELEKNWHFERNDKKKVQNESFQSTETADGTEEKSSIQTKYVIKEPDYIKLYIKDIVLLHELPKTLTDFIIALFKHINYNGQINLNSSVKKQLAEELKFKGKTTKNNIQMIDNKLSQLKKADLIRTVARGIVEANPFFFGRGKWDEIRNQRDNWIKVSYKNNKREIKTKNSEGQSLTINSEN